MECEMCGNPIYGRPSRVRVEGTLMSTCKRCARFGVEEERGVGTSAFKGSRPGPRAAEIDRLELVMDYGARIRRAREGRSLTQEELANLINERTSVIARVESQKMGFNEKMARKLEKLLGIQLFEKIE